MTSPVLGDDFAGAIHRHFATDYPSVARDFHFRTKSPRAASHARVLGFGAKKLLEK
jgi:hypothetical protein